MKIITSIIIITYLVTLINTHPISKNEGLRSKTLERVVVADKDEDPALRGKRTIGVLRQFFPDITKIIDDKVNMIVSEVIRALGPTVLRGFLGGGAFGNGNDNNNPRNKDEGSTVTIAAPPDGEFDDDDDDFNTDSEQNKSRVSIPLPEDLSTLNSIDTSTPPTKLFTQNSSTTDETLNDTEGRKPRSGKSSIRRRRRGISEERNQSSIWKQSNRFNKRSIRTGISSIGRNSSHGRRREQEQKIPEFWLRK